jgi:hypothetical protein
MTSMGTNMGRQSRRQLLIMDRAESGSCLAVARYDVCMYLSFPARFICLKAVLIDRVS